MGATFVAATALCNLQTTTMPIRELLREFVVG
jgi:hypothetical protein